MICVGRSAASASGKPSIVQESSSDFRTTQPRAMRLAWHGSIRPLSPRAPVCCARPLRAADQAS
jgi:hypothetical protein